MFLKKFDFLNSLPQLYFLEKKTNKTLFGGILFIIYFLLMLTISIFYILDYCLNDKYDIRYSLYKHYSNEKDLETHNNEVFRNFNFTFSFLKVTRNLKREELNSNFILIDSKFNEIGREETVNLTSNNKLLYVIYTCSGNCTPDDTKDDMLYLMDINYPGYKIDHQNDKIPLETNMNDAKFKTTLFFNYNIMNVFEINFEILKYKEEKGLLGLFDNWMNKKNEYICVEIESVSKTDSQTLLDIEEEREGGKFIMKILCVIRFDNDKHQIEEYVRKRRSPLNVLANIGSLFSTFFTMFSFIFKFYSEKNNNYTIIKKLLSSPRILRNSSPNINISKSKTIKFENNSNRNKKYRNYERKSIDTSKSVPFKSENNEIIITNKIINNNNREKNEQYDDIIYLNKIYFIDFLIKNIICKKNKKKKNYIIIDICDEIICKYISVENILYNQIIFENLL